MEEDARFTDATFKALEAGLNREHEDELDDLFEDEPDASEVDADVVPKRQPWESFDAEDHLTMIGPTAAAIVRPYLLELITTGQLPPHIRRQLAELADDKLEPRLLEIHAAAVPLFDGELATEVARPLIAQYRGYEGRLLEMFALAIR